MVRRPGSAARRALRRAASWWWFVVGLALIGAVAGHALSPRVQTFRATTTMLAGVPTDDAFVQPDDVVASADLARVLAAMIPQERVIGGVTRQLGLETDWRRVRAGVRASVIGRSGRLLEVSATAPSAQEATAIASAIPGQLAALAFPDAPPANTRTFLWARIDAVRGHIAASERHLMALEARYAGGPRNARIARRLADARGVVDRWDASLSSLYRELERATSADHLQVLGSPTITARPLFPSEAWLDIALAIVGLLVGVAVVNVWAFRGQRRGRGLAVPTYAS